MSHRYAAPKSRACPDCGTEAGPGSCFLPGLKTPRQVEYAKKHVHEDCRCKPCGDKRFSVQIPVVEVVT